MFSDPTKWQRRYQQVLLKEWDEVRRELHIIPQQILIVNSAFVAVEVLHQPHKPSWKYAGRAYQLITGFDGQLFRLGDSSKSLSLVRPNFLSFEFGRAIEWTIEIEFALHLERVQLTVWQYNGAS